MVRLVSIGIWMPKPGSHPPGVEAKYLKEWLEAE
ncbi:hypothetical protein NIES3275_81260 (plasmid) [Microchaete diplosiphon NIES-3275]|nr:hypothetical protein NIES3275_81260 [Microchaete diplosiphon NIES-3275]